MFSVGFVVRALDYFGTIEIYNDDKRNGYKT